MTLVTESSALFVARGIAKRFSHVEALRSVDFTVTAGEVVALLGDNGAGKSTLIKIVSGLEQPDRGELFWEGQPLKLRSARDAGALGIATVHQDLALIDTLSVYRNVFLGRERTVSYGLGPVRMLNHRRAAAQAVGALGALGIHLPNPGIAVGRLSGGQRQAIAIARAVHFSARLLILDEPTSALSVRQAHCVLEAIDAARQRGVAVVLISHNVLQAESIADRHVILSRGESVASFNRGDASPDEISDLIAGKTHQAPVGRSRHLHGES